MRILWWCRGVWDESFLSRGVTVSIFFYWESWTLFRWLWRKCSSGKFWGRTGSCVWSQITRSVVLFNIQNLYQGIISGIFLILAIFWTVLSCTGSTESSFKRLAFRSAWFSGGKRRSACTCSCECMKSNSTRC
jgi:hypothetical protein